MCRTGNLTRLIHALAICVTIQDAFETSPNLRPKVEGLHLRIFSEGREASILEVFGDCIGMYCYNQDDMKENYETNGLLESSSEVANLKII